MRVKKKFIFEKFHRFDGFKGLRIFKEKDAHYQSSIRGIVSIFLLKSIIY